MSRATVGRVMKRNEISPRLNVYWCIPPHEDAEFVANMEDILDIYQLPYDQDFHRIPDIQALRNKLKEWNDA